MDTFISIVLSAMATLVVLSVHEYSHALAANLLGDPTAKSVGRLSLNPIKHLDPVGALCMIFFHIGWAKPVPIDPRYFKKPKRDFAITAMAGPLANLLCAFFSAFFIGVLGGCLTNATEANFGFYFLYYSWYFSILFMYINIGIAVFNLIPIPPLDGSRLLNAFLPPRAYFQWMKYEKYFYYGLLAWLFLGGYVANALLAIGGNNPVVTVLANILSLSDLLETAISFLADLMYSAFSALSFTFYF